MIFLQTTLILIFKLSLGETKGNIRLPGTMMLGYVAAHSETLAMAVIRSKGVSQLAIILSEESDDHIKDWFKNARFRSITYT